MLAAPGPGWVLRFPGMRDNPEDLVTSGGRGAHRQAQHPGSCVQRRSELGLGLTVGHVNSESHALLILSGVNVGGSFYLSITHQWREWPSARGTVRMREESTWMDSAQRLAHGEFSREVSLGVVL